jgi:hypothetical protein
LSLFIHLSGIFFDHCFVFLDLFFFLFLWLQGLFEEEERSKHEEQTDETYEDDRLEVSRSGEIDAHRG